MFQMKNLAENFSLVFARFIEVVVDPLLPL